MASNVGKKPVTIKDGVTVVVDQGIISVTGGKGTLSEKLPKGISLEIADNVATVKKEHKGVELEKFAGLTRALLANMVIGVSDGFTKNLELSGVGYRAKIEGRDLVLNVGFANAVRITPPEGVEIAVVENTISVKGANKAVIGDLASKIREVRIPDPYKAKGIKYAGEHIRRKVGKAAKAVGGAK